MSNDNQGRIGLRFDLVQKGIHIDARLQRAPRMYIRRLGELAGDKFCRALRPLEGRRGNALECGFARCKHAPDHCRCMFTPRTQRPVCITGRIRAEWERFGVTDKVQVHEFFFASPARAAAYPGLITSYITWMRLLYGRNALFIALIVSFSNASRFSLNT
jgi:hypothetical protein